MFEEKKKRKVKDIFQNQYMLNDVYDFFSKKYSNKEKGGVNKQNFGKVCSLINHKFVEHVMAPSQGNSLYISGLGLFFIRKYKPKKKLIDFHNTLKYNKKIYFENEHTNGYVYKFVWRPDYKSNKYFHMYYFKETRYNKRELKNKINNGADYCL